MELRVVRHTDRFDDTLTFYTNVVGLDVLRAWTDGGRGVLITAADGGRIELLEAESAQVEPVRGVFIALRVDDVEAVAARLRAAGYELTQPPTTQPWGHRNLSVIDPAGTPVTLFQVL